MTELLGVADAPLTTAAYDTAGDPELDCAGDGAVAVLLEALDKGRCNCGDWPEPSAVLIVDITVLDIVVVAILAQRE